MVQPRVLHLAPLLNLVLAQTADPTFCLRARELARGPAPARVPATHSGNARVAVPARRKGIA
eukprot:2850958-Pyramimonas_sp.AAC.1